MNGGLVQPAVRRSSESGSPPRSHTQTTRPPARQAPEARAPTGGRQLPPSTRERMEAAFGLPLDHVRVHTDAEAIELAEDHDAEALTIGRDIAFGRDRFRPDDEEGARLLAHELTHVVQQDAHDDGSAVAHGPTSEPSEPVEREADRAAARVARGEAARVAPGGATWTTRARIMRRARAGGAAVAAQPPGPEAAAATSPTAEAAPSPTAEAAPADPALAATAPAAPDAAPEDPAPAATAPAAPDAAPEEALPPEVTPAEAPAQAETAPVAPEAHDAAPAPVAAPTAAKPAELSPPPVEPGPEFESEEAAALTPELDAAKQQVAARVLLVPPHTDPPTAPVTALITPDPSLRRALQVAPHEEATETGAPAREVEAMARAPPDAERPHAPIIQPKLSVSSPGDPLEREADAVAVRVLRGGAPGPASCGGVPAGRLQCALPPARGPPPTTGHPLPRSVASVVAAPGGGRPMDAAVRARIEPHVGVDLSHVRVRQEPAAAAAAHDLRARAFTSGSTIFLAAESSPTDVALMAHEATHVGQQQTVAAARTTLMRDVADFLPDVSVSDVIPDWILDGVRSAVRAIPGYTLLTYITGNDPLTDEPVAVSREELIETLLTYGPFGAAVGTVLQSIDVLGEVFDFVSEGLAAHDLTLARLKRDIDSAWEELSVTNGIAGNVAIVERYVNALLRDVGSFVGSIVDRVLEIVRSVVAEVAEPLLETPEIAPVWNLAKKVMHYDPLRGVEVQAETVEIIADFLRLRGEEQRLAQMEERGTLQETADWLDTQLGTFKSLVGELGTLFSDAWAAIQPQNLPDLFTNLGELAQRAFGFVQRVGEFAATVIVKILELIKNALLGWLSEHAHQVPGFHLLTVILGQNPFTKERVLRTAENLIKGFITLMPGGEATYEQLAESGVIGSAAQRIEGEMARLGISLELITGIFLGIWDTLTLDDLLDPIGAFGRILDLFGEPLSRLIEFIGVVIEVVITLVLRLMNFPSDLLGSIIANALQAIEDIKRDPVAFVKNMLAAVKLGLSGFFDNILTYLTQGLTAWLFRGLGQLGITIPSDFTLQSILTLVVQVLGITVDTLWTKLGKHIGEERVAMIRGAIDRLSGAWAFIKDVQEGGIAAVWRYVTDQLSGLWDTLIGMAKDWIMTTIIGRVTTKLLTMLDPTGVMAVVNSFIAFFAAVQSAIEYLRDILEIINRYVTTLAQVAAGNIVPGAQMLEQGLASAIPVAIGFLANQVGLGNIPEKIVEIIGGLRQLVDEALDWLIGQAVRLGQAVLGALGIGGDRPGPATVDPTDHEAVATQVHHEMQTPPVAPVDYPALRAQKDAQARTIEQRYVGTLGQGIRLSIHFQPQAEDAPDEDLDFEVVIAPNTTRKPGSVPARERGIDPEPSGEIDFSTNRAVVRFTVLTYPPYEMSHSLQRHHYNFLNQEGGNPEAQNSLMHHDLEPDVALDDAIGVARNIQGKLRQNLRADIPVGDRYRVNTREYVVDSTTHFFVVSGSQVWGGVSRSQWIAARLLRRVERDAISPAQVRRMVTARTRQRLIAGGARAEDFERPIGLVTTAANEISRANAYIGLGVVSGRPDLVAAFLDLNRLEGR